MKKIVFGISFSVLFSLLCVFGVVFNSMVSAQGMYDAYLLKDLNMLLFKILQFCLGVGCLYLIKYIYKIGVWITMYGEKND